MLGAKISFSIFMASKMHKTAPALTWSPFFTLTLTILPAIGAVTAPSAAILPVGVFMATGVGMAVVDVCGLKRGNCVFTSALRGMSLILTVNGACLFGLLIWIV